MKTNERGRYGYYYAYTDDEIRSLVVFPSMNSTDWTPNNVLVIPSDKLSGFVTELITMARDLGVTGGEVQAEPIHPAMHEMFGDTLTALDRIKVRRESDDA